MRAALVALALVACARPTAPRNRAGIVASPFAAGAEAERFLDGDADHGDWSAGLTLGLVWEGVDALLERPRERDATIVALNPFVRWHADPPTDWLTLALDGKLSFVWFLPENDLSRARFALRSRRPPRPRPTIVGVRPGGRGREAVPVPHRRRRDSLPRRPHHAGRRAQPRPPLVIRAPALARSSSSLVRYLAGSPAFRSQWMIGFMRRSATWGPLITSPPGWSSAGTWRVSPRWARSILPRLVVEAEAREAGDTSRPGRACPAPGRTCRAELPTIPRPSHRRCGASSSAERRHVERSARSSARSRRKRGQRVIRGRARRAEVRFARAEPSGRSTRRCRTRSAARIAGDDSRRGPTPCQSASRRWRRSLIGSALASCAMSSRVVYRARLARTMPRRRITRRSPPDCPARRAPSARGDRLSDSVACSS